MVYIDEFGTAFTVSAEIALVVPDGAAPEMPPVNKTVISFPKPLIIDEPVKLASVGFSHAFCVTHSNKIYSWVAQNPTSFEASG